MRINIGLYDFVFTLVLSVVVMAIIGFAVGANAEAARLNAKCLKEYAAKAHNEAVALCKERVK
jgi:ammonia channel protein AmtB